MMGYSVLSHLKHLAAPLAALMVLSACSVSVDEGRPQWQQHPDRPGGAMRPDYPSGAMRPDYPSGAMQPGRPSGNWGGNNGGNWGGNNRPQTACTREYAPVCATSRGRSQTFPNACVARNAGYENMRNGACR